MSVLIKGMEMPYCCTDCRFMADGWCYAISADDKQPAEARMKRPDWCPLDPVPPHGRLIEAGELQKAIHEHEYILRDYFGTKDNGMFTCGIDYAIQTAPTIIEAEGVRE